MNLLTICIAVFIITFMIIGAAKGFVRSALGIIFSLIAIAAAYLLVPVTANLIIDYTDIDEAIERKINARIETEIEKRVKDEVENLGIGAVTADEGIINSIKNEILKSEPNKNQQIDIINNLSVSDTLKKALIENNNMEIKNEMGTTGFYDYITKYITYRMVNLIAYISTFALIGLIFAVIKFALRFAVKLPIIGSLNKIGGAALGFVEAVIIIWVFLIIVDNLPNYSWCLRLSEQINESGLITFIYEKNVFSHLLEDIKNQIK